MNLTFYNLERDPNCIMKKLIVDGVIQRSQVNFRTLRDDLAYFQFNEQFEYCIANYDPIASDWYIRIKEIIKIIEKQGIEFDTNDNCKD